MTVQSIDFNDADNISANVGRELFRYYFETAGNATPAKVKPLIAWLGRLTFEVRQRMSASPGAFIEYAQLRGDLRAWQERLDVYRATVDELHERGRNEPSPELAEGVLMPLVSGHYPGEDGRRAPDYSTPLGLMSAADATAENYAQAWSRLKADLAESAGGLVGGASEFSGWIKGVVVGVAGLGLYSLWRDLNR